MGKSGTIGLFRPGPAVPRLRTTGAGGAQQTYPKGGVLGSAGQNSEFASRKKLSMSSQNDNVRNFVMGCVA